LTLHPDLCDAVGIGDFQPSRALPRDPDFRPPHYLFDRGVFSLSEGLAVTVSERAHGSSGLEEALLRFHRAPIRDPVNPEYRLGEAYLDWHRREVFHGPGRV